MIKIFKAEEFYDPIKTYLRKYKHDLPPDASRTGLVESAIGYADQKVVTRFAHRSKTTKEFRLMLKKATQVSRNLNYSEPLETWRDFYVLPKPERAAEYAKEENIHIENVVNFSNETIENFADELIEIIEAGSERVNNIKFLTGNTGVGKTTFLKYFSKTQKNRFLRADVVTSRVKFLDVERRIQGAKRQGEADLLHVFLAEVLDCLIRDICDALERYRDKAEFPRGEKIKKLQSTVDDVLESLIQRKGLDIDEVISEVSEDTKYLRRLDESDKVRLLERARQSGFKFCIILDGFDAMNPEEIQLFENDKEAEFFECLSSLIKNGYATGNEIGETLASLNKLFLVAVRPVTVTQLENDVRLDTDFHQHVEDNFAHVVGTDVYASLEARCRVFFDEHFSSIDDRDQFVMWVSDMIRFVMKVLYKNHANLREGRFLDLFNHNVREKFLFLRETIDLVIYKVEQHHSKSVRRGDEVEPLSIAGFLECLADENVRSHIELYEVQRLLILNRDGFFRNFFRFDLMKLEFVQERSRGQFDNLFNYHIKKPYGSEGEPFTFAKDPLLEKWIICQKLKMDSQPNSTWPGVELENLKSWFEENFHFTRISPENLRILIRSGIVSVSSIGGSNFLKLSTKGAFIIDELCTTSIYLEHVALNSVLPTFVAEKILSPTKRSNRVWGRQAISNVCLFIVYSRQVLLESIKSDKTELRKFLLEKLVGNSIDRLEHSFMGVVREGIENQPESYRDYATELSQELRSIGVTIDSR